MENAVDTHKQNKQKMLTFLKEHTPNQERPRNTLLLELTPNGGPGSVTTKVQLRKVDSRIVDLNFRLICRPNYSTSPWASITIS